MTVAPVEFTRPPTGTQVRSLEHVHVKGRCIKRRDADPCPERFHEGDIISITVVGTVVRAMPCNEGQELKVDTARGTPNEGQWVYVRTDDNNVIIAKLGEGV